jgi:ATP-dependent helicase/DNAse subunit B
MEITSISPSSYKVIDECEMKYFMQYILKMRQPPGDAAKMGTCVHLFLEYLALLKKAHQENIKEIELEGLGKYEVVDPFAINTDELFEAVFNYYSKKDELPESYRLQCYKHIQAALESSDDPRKNYVVSTEYEFSIEIPLPWASYSYEGKDAQKKGYIKINGIIDLIYKLDDDTYKIVDWKSSKSRKDWVTGVLKGHDEFEKDIQLKIYDMVLKSLYPEIKNFHICIFFTVAGGPFDLVFSEDSPAETMKEIKKQVNKVRNISVPKQNKSFRCKFCPFYKMKLEGALIENRRNQFDEIGQEMCACSHIHSMLKEGKHNDVITKYKL